PVEQNAYNPHYVKLTKGISENNAS
ncbi:MAG: hypothetical protein ACI9BS_002039, partial [Candidatus Poriferisodalaceae bacterium]